MNSNKYLKHIFVIIINVVEMKPQNFAQKIVPQEKSVNTWNLTLFMFTIFCLHTVICYVLLISDLPR